MSQSLVRGSILLSIEIKGEGDNGGLAVLLEYLLMGQGYQVDRGPVYGNGMTEVQRAQILRRMILEKQTHIDLTPVRLDVIL